MHKERLHQVAGRQGGLPDEGPDSLGFAIPAGTMEHGTGTLTDFSRNHNPVPPGGLRPERLEFVALTPIFGDPPGGRELIAQGVRGGPVFRGPGLPAFLGDFANLVGDLDSLLGGLDSAGEVFLQTR